LNVGVLAMQCGRQKATPSVPNSPAQPFLAGPFPDRPLPAGIAAYDGGSVSAPLVLSAGRYTLSADLAIGEPLYFSPGARLRIEPGVTLSLEGGYEAGDMQQVFEMAPDAVLHVSRRNHLTPQHFGVTGKSDASNFAKAIEAADESGIPIKIPTGAIDLSDLKAPVPLKRGLVIYGEGQQSRISGPGPFTSLFYVRQASEARISCHSVSLSNFRWAFQFEPNERFGPYTIDIDRCLCDHFGGAILGVADGAYIKATTITLTDCVLTNMGMDRKSYRAYAIDIPILECQKTLVSRNLIEGVGSPDHVRNAVGIWVDCSPSPDKGQSVIVSDNIVRQVSSGTNQGTDQVGGIFVLEAHAVISNNVIDTVEANAHASSPEGIYTKSSHSLISNNTIIDVRGAEGVINMKGELSGVGRSSERSLCKGNVIGSRKPPQLPSTGINLGAPRITCAGNLIDGCIRGIIVGFDDTVVCENVMRNIRTTGIEVIPSLRDSNLVINNNILQNLGGPTEPFAAGILATLTDKNGFNLFQITGNSFLSMQTASRGSSFGIRVIMEGRESNIRRAVWTGNAFSQLGTAASIEANNRQEIDILNFTGNSILGAQKSFSSNANARKSWEQPNFEALESDRQR
jgi:hypothetical protein